jgi:predicted O-linked N-acetylglucosamine transferase (SPINDLY family)
MDYRLTTVDVDPEGVDRFYSERLYRLPRTLWCYRSPLIDSVPAAGETPALSRGSVTFGSMNNVAKVSDETVGVWGAILNRVAGAHLVMTSIPEGSARERLWERFKAQGVEPGRVELYGRLPTAEFVGLMNRIDIALDPFPYNGTTTTCEALWRGVPVVGVEGRTSVSRSGYALLKTAGLEELCGKNEAHYVEIAVRLAKDLPRLNGLRQGMRQRLEASPLRDEAGFARDVEAAYRAMWRQWCNS